MELKYQNNRYKFEVDYSLLDFEHAIKADSSIIYIPYCIDYYSPTNAEFRNFIKPYICDLILADSRGADIDYARPTFWLMLNYSTKLVKFAVTHNYTFDGEYVEDESMCEDELKSVALAPEKKALLDRAKFLW